MSDATTIPEIRLEAAREERERITEEMGPLLAAAKQALDLLERVPESGSDTIHIEVIRQRLRAALSNYPAATR